MLFIRLYNAVHPCKNAIWLNTPWQTKMTSKDPALKYHTSIRGQSNLTWRVAWLLYCVFYWLNFNNFLFLSNPCSYEPDSKYMCVPSRKDVMQLLLNIHNQRNGDRQKDVSFCNRKRPAKAIFTNIRFLGWIT
jgi:hypothetical protein